MSDRDKDVETLALRHQLKVDLVHRPSDSLAAVGCVSYPQQTTSPPLQGNHNHPAKPTDQRKTR
jgi:hypothetical protein